MPKIAFQKSDVFTFTCFAKHCSGQRHHFPLFRAQIWAQSITAQNLPGLVRGPASIASLRTLISPGHCPTIHNGSIVRETHTSGSSRRFFGGGF